MKWLSVNQTLPSLGQMVSALVKNKIPLVVKFSGDCFTDDGLEVENVTHWMEIPSVVE
jgi:hypothetical protein